MSSDPAAAQIIVLSGGGSMADGWHGLQTLQRYGNKFPDTPLAVLPSSFHIIETDLRQLLAGRAAATWLFARERESAKLLRAVNFSGDVRIGLDHDLAMNLSDHPMISQRRETAGDSIVLIVERDDWEGPTGRRRVLAPAGLEFVLERARTAVRKHLLGRWRRKQDQNSAFNQAALTFLARKGHDLVGTTVISSDISLAEVNDFESYLDTIAGAAVIVTTRLHVAIVAHLLSKSCYLVEGSYHKIRGVYEYSLKGRESWLVRWDGQVLQDA